MPCRPRNPSRRGPAPAGTGISDQADPSRSRLLLHDHQHDPFTVMALAPIRLDQAYLAFLSACETALTTDARLLDEAIHLASAFQLAGYPHVIGTLWSIADDAAFTLTKAFYEGLFILRMDHAPALPHQQLTTLDERLADAAARPIVLPETIVVDRGKVFVSRAFTAACETLGISVQPAPPFTPTAKGIVERAFGTINALFCQHLPGYTGSDVTRRGPDAEQEACYSVPHLQDLLDE
ncbi:CHAT domain-containing protein [Streptomyces avermitilis]|uniref:CHAT domain-containing protein n=1 Tax=Streptomyces avermitilis TaxID=33903 RepID=UPI00367641DA